MPCFVSWVMTSSYTILSVAIVQEIALSAGARVVKRLFDNWSAHQNWGLSNINFRNPWVFYIDADERLSPEAIDEIQSIVNLPIMIVWRIVYVVVITSRVGSCGMCRLLLGTSVYSVLSLFTMSVW